MGAGTSRVSRSFRGCASACACVYTCHVGECRNDAAAIVGVTAHEDGARRGGGGVLNWWSDPASYIGHVWKIKTREGDYGVGHGRSSCCKNDLGQGILLCASSRPSPFNNIQPTGGRQCGFRHRGHHKDAQGATTSSFEGGRVILRSTESAISRCDLHRSSCIEWWWMDVRWVGIFSGPG